MHNIVTSNDFCSICEYTDSMGSVYIIACTQAGGIDIIPALVQPEKKVKEKDNVNSYEPKYDGTLIGIQFNYERDRSQIINTLRYFIKNIYLHDISNLMLTDRAITLYHQKRSIDSVYNSQDELYVVDNQYTKLYYKFIINAIEKEVIDAKLHVLGIKANYLRQNPYMSYKYGIDALEVFATRNDISNMDKLCCNTLIALFKEEMQYNNIMRAGKNGTNDMEMGNSTCNNDSDGSDAE